MEPLHPELRAALKQAHPGLTDEEIDLSEELLARRMGCDPEKEADRIERLDRERAELIQRVMPRYAEVARAFAARTSRPQPRVTSKVTVRIKRPEP